MIRKFIKFGKATTQTIPSAQMYIDRFASLQTTLKQHQKRLQQLQVQAQLAENAQVMTINDRIQKAISNVTGGSFQSKAMRQLRNQLIAYRNQLDNKIQQTDTKWQKPRQQIIKARKQISNQFLSKFIKLEDNLLRSCSVGTSPQLAEGLVLIHRLLINTLEKHGVCFFEPEIGSEYNPQLQDTVDKVAKDQKTIKQVVARGWKIDQKIIKRSVVRLQ